MAIKVQTSHVMLLTFWTGVIFTLGSLWAIFSGLDTNESGMYFLIFGLFCNISSIYYYRKVGWSELRNDSLGCLALIVIFSIIRYIYNYFFG